jgi:hypothetical protein
MQQLFFFLAFIRSLTNWAAFSRISEHADLQLLRGVNRSLKIHRQNLTLKKFFWYFLNPFF